MPVCSPLPQTRLRVEDHSERYFSKNRRCAGLASGYTRYDAQNNLVREDRPDDTFVQYGWDGLGRPLSVTRPEGLQVVLDYQDHADDSIQIYTDAFGQETITIYDDFGRLVSTQYPDGEQESTKYDASHQPIEIEQSSGTKIVQTFDAAGRLVRRDITQAGDIPGPPAETFQWDGLERLKQITRGAYTTSYGYDTLSRVLSESTAGKSVGYQYDPAGNPSRIQYPSGTGTVDQTWTAQGQLDRVTRPFEPDWAADFDWSGSLLARRTADNLRTLYQHDDAGRRVGQAGYWGSRSIHGEALTLDDRGLLVSSRRTDGGSSGTSWTLDDAGRILETRRIRFDEGGNPIPGSEALWGSLSPLESFDYL